MLVKITAKDADALNLIRKTADGKLYTWQEDGMSIFIDIGSCREVCSNILVWFKNTPITELSITGICLGAHPDGVLNRHTVERVHQILTNYVVKRAPEGVELYINERSVRISGDVNRILNIPVISLLTYIPRYVEALGALLESGIITPRALEIYLSPNYVVNRWGEELKFSSRDLVDFSRLGFVSSLIRYGEDMLNFMAYLSPRLLDDYRFEVSPENEVDGFKTWLRCYAEVIMDSPFHRFEREA